MGIFDGRSVGGIDGERLGVRVGTAEGATDGDIDGL